MYLPRAAAAVAVVVVLGTIATHASPSAAAVECTGESARLIEKVPGFIVDTGTSQTVVDASGPARYIHSGTKTFTRDVDVLTPGHRLETGAGVCTVHYQRPVRCEVGEHGFVLDHQFGTLD